MTEYEITTWMYENTQWVNGDLVVGSEALANLFLRIKTTQEWLDKFQGETGALTIKIMELQQQIKELEGELCPFCKSGKSPISKSPDRNALDELCQHLVERVWTRREDWKSTSCMS